MARQKNELRVHNNFNDFRLKNMNKSEIILFMLLCLMVNREVDDYNIPYVAILRDNHFTQDTFAKVKALLVQLAKKLAAEASIYKNRDGVIIVDSLFGFRFWPDKNYFTVKVNPDLKEMIIDVNENYTILDIDIMNSFKSIHAVKLYRKLKQFNYTGLYVATKEDYYDMAGIELTSPVGNTISRVILPAVEELKATFPNLSFEKVTEYGNERGKGSTVTGFKFTWTPEERTLTEEQKKAIEKKKAQVVVDEVNNTQPEIVEAIGSVVKKAREEAQECAGFYDPNDDEMPFY